MNEEKSLSCIEIETSTPVEKSVIWLHGLGADGNDFVPIVPELHLPDSAKIRFIFPHAPIMSVTINNGFQMRAWFDITSLEINQQLDQMGITKSVALIEDLIAKEESRGIAAEKIVLAGFSQGAVVALATGLTYQKPLAGIVALSGFLPFTPATLPTNSINHQVPIFIGHGAADPVVPYFLGQIAATSLTQAGWPVTWKSYAMAHSVNLAEINDISHWLQQL